MGLDIIAISKLVKAEGKDGEVRIGDDPEYNKGIEPGPYNTTMESRRTDFRVGPYSFYNRFRETLSRCMHGVEPVEIWDSVEDYKGKSFIELIDFSDCDGRLGGAVCEKLYEDFAENRPKFKEYIDSQGWDEEKIEDYLSVYEDFMKAFEIGREEGVVIFC
jgi:hypothetical protein